MNNYIFLINGVSYFAVSLTLSCLFFIIHKKVSRHIKRIIYFMGILYSILFALNLFWLFNFSAPSFNDTLLIWSLFFVIQSILFLSILYNIQYDKRLFYSFLIFILPFIFIENFDYFFSSLGIAALLLTAGIFIYLITRPIKSIGILGLLYAVISIIFQALIFFDIDYTRLWWFIPNIALVSIILILILKQESFKELKELKNEFKEKEIKIWLITIKYFVYVGILSLFIFIGVVAIHETGHALAAQFYNCEESRAIIYDINNPLHTYTICSQPHNRFVLMMSGVILPFIFGLLFLLLGIEFMAYLSYLILGFAILSSYGDLIAFNVPMNLALVSSIFAMTVIFFALFKLGNYLIREETIPRKICESQLKCIEQGKCLWLTNGLLVQNLYDLAHALAVMDDKTYKYHVNEFKNDFAVWVRDVMETPSLASELLKVKNKGEAHKLILKRLLEAATYAKKR